MSLGILDGNSLPVEGEILVVTFKVVGRSVEVGKTVGEVNGDDAVVSLTAVDGACVVLSVSFNVTVETNVVFFAVVGISVTAGVELGGSVEGSAGSTTNLAVSDPKSSPDLLKTLHDTSVLLSAAAVSKILSVLPLSPTSSLPVLRDPPPWSCQE